MGSIPIIRSSSALAQGVAQFGSVSVLGTEGRRFKSCHPEEILTCLQLQGMRCFAVLIDLFY